jgi:hypothetical protein
MSFHFIMTATHPAHNGFATVTYSGVYVPISGETRADIYTKILDDLAKEIRVNRPSVVFFSLEPNELSAA